MKLKDFHHKNVPGLYTFDHFEHVSGAFVQVHAGGGLWVYQAPDGTRQDFYSIAALKAHIETTDRA